MLYPAERILVRPISMKSPHEGERTVPPRELSVFDSICIIAGIIMGVGIYETAPTVAGAMPNATWTLLAWVLGGVFTLAGALTYAELASAYPREGGDYVYLTRAYGEWAGFLFAWANLVILRPGFIASIAFPFAHYLEKVWTPLAGTRWESHEAVIMAVVATVVLTMINVLGVHHGAWMQNILMSVKALGILAIFVVGLWGAPSSTPIEPARSLNVSGLNLAMILVLFTYGGWSEIAYVAAEVRDPKRNLVRSLVWGTIVVTGLYLLVNVAFLQTLGHARMAASKAVAADTVAVVFPKYASSAISLLICLSALGAMNGLIFAGARISHALGEDYRLFSRLGRWSRRFETPASALWVQGGMTVALLVLAGSFQGVLLYTTGVLWAFFLATGVSLFVLRAREPDQPRPYKVTGYPWTPLLFCASCVFIIYSALAYDARGTMVSAAILCLGLPLYRLSRGRPGFRRSGSPVS